MIRKLSVFDHLDKRLLEEARVESVLALECQKPTVLLADGKIIGLIVTCKKGNRFWVERFYVLDIQRRLKSAYDLLCKGLEEVGCKKTFYYEVEKTNPKVNHLFFQNSETVSENAMTIIKKRGLNGNV